MTRFLSSIPVVGPVWDRIEKLYPVRMVVDETKLAWRYKRLFPCSVEMPESGASVFVDRYEPRGRAVLLCKAQGQRSTKRWFHAAYSHLQPDIVIDVGANYGEFVFAGRYRPETRVIAVEANSTLHPFLGQSRETHPDRDQIEIIHALAGARSDADQAFYVDPGSSGRSSAVPRGEHCEEQIVKTLALDDLFEPASLAESKLLFKIDVEGFEAHVMSGMTSLLSTTGQRFGIIEFNSSLIHRSGIDPESFLEGICSRHSVAALRKGHAPEFIGEPSLDRLRAYCGNDEIEVDLIIASDESLFRRVEELRGSLE